MKALLSVFECDPLKGSDSYVGWSYVVNMGQFNEIYVLTREDNKENIENFCSEHDVPYLERIHFIYIKRSKLFAEYLYRINHYIGFLGSYFVWQRKAYIAAKDICANDNISICHHVTIADFRCMGYLWKLGKPFIYGPVGGGQEIPYCLKDYYKDYEKVEKFRMYINKIMTSLPGYKRGLHHASMIYSSNDETTICIKKSIKPADEGKLKQMTELCIDEKYLDERKNLQKSRNDKVVHIIVSGRLIYRKGIALLLDAVRLVKTDIPFVVDIYGDGDQKSELVKQVKVLEIETLVIFHGKVPFNEMQQRYKEGDIYVLPSLRETTGTAVFEAMANKLPVIALKHNGVKYVVGEDAGILIEIISSKQVMTDFSMALKLLIENKDLRLQLGSRGFEKIKQNYTWTKRAKMMNKIYCDLCREE